jgi:hypothetical protein
MVYESKMWACKKWNCLYSIVHNNCPPIAKSSGQVVEDKKKLVQFVTILNLLSKGKPMIGYEDF